MLIKHSLVDINEKNFEKCLNFLSDKYSIEDNDQCKREYNRVAKTKDTRKSSRIKGQTKDSVLKDTKSESNVMEVFSSPQSKKEVDEQTTQLIKTEDQMSDIDDSMSEKISKADDSQFVEADQ
jgi:hypothetical protein